MAAKLGPTGTRVGSSKAPIRSSVWANGDGRAGRPDIRPDLLVSGALDLLAFAELV